MSHAPAGDLPRLVSGIYFFAQHSPPAVARTLLERLCLDPQTHPDWLALLPYCLPRLAQLIPSPHSGAPAGEFDADWTVPLRATSPHHIYYGIWENGVQQRGYMTVFEAWAETAKGPLDPRPAQQVAPKESTLPLAHVGAGLSQKVVQ